MIQYSYKHYLLELRLYQLKALQKAVLSLQQKNEMATKVGQLLHSNQDRQASHLHSQADAYIIGTNCQMATLYIPHKLNRTDKGHGGYL